MKEKKPRKSIPINQMFDGQIKKKKEIQLENDKKKQ